jgi:hypothetical protein
VPGFSYHVGTLFKLTYAIALSLLNSIGEYSNCFKWFNIVFVFVLSLEIRNINYFSVFYFRLIAEFSLSLGVNAELINFFVDGLPIIPLSKDIETASLVPPDK